MRKKRPSIPALQSIAHWSTSDGKKLQDYCCQNSMPQGVIKADLSKQAPHNSYGPPLWYVDQERTGRDCGQEFAWTAKQQQYWFEVLKLPIQVQVLRCPACSRKLRLAKAAQKAHQVKIARK
jgi:hypothetical protein